MGQRGRNAPPCGKSGGDRMKTFPLLGLGTSNLFTALQAFHGPEPCLPLGKRWQTLC